MSDDKVYCVQFATGQRLGKSMRQAKELVDKAKGFSSIEIIVVPVKEIERLRTEIHRLRGRLSHYETLTAWIDE